MINEPNEKVQAHPLGLAVHHTVKVMQMEYTSSFNRNYPDDHAITELLRYLCIKLKGIEPKCIIDAYDNVTSMQSQFMPEIKALLNEAIKLNKKHTQLLEEQQEVEKKAALPPPKIINCDPVKLLQEAINEKKDTRTKEEWMDDKEKARIDSLKKVKHKGNRFIDESYNCSKFGCGKPGTHTSSTNGSTNWYCKKHYIRG